MKKKDLQIKIIYLGDNSCARDKVGSLFAAVVETTPGGTPHFANVNSPTAGEGFVIA
jgi:hypothetical protein